MGQVHFARDYRIFSPKILGHAKAREEVVRRKNEKVIWKCTTNGLKDIVKPATREIRSNENGIEKINHKGPTEAKKSCVCCLVLKIGWRVV